jgi:AcrR family transcriptional regulator
MRSVDDLTTKARIRDAAIALFARDGVAATGVRAVAEEAGVSLGLVNHHFGSKEGLRRACDEYIVSAIREAKMAAVTAGPGLDPVGALRQTAAGVPMMKYLARVLIEGSPTVSALVDDLVADATEYLAKGVEAGMLKPSDHSDARAAVLTIWSLGALVLHEHVNRLLDVDLTAENLVDQPGITNYFAPAIELYTDGLVTEAFGSTLRNAFTHPTKEPTND